MVMHNFDNSSSNVPAFLVKLWKLVEDDECNELITWNESGTTFIIRNQTRFAKDLLPQYFKHNNMASFIRQLNMYGFRKVINYEKSGLRYENDEIEFQHVYFCKGQGSLLDLIKRKLPNAKCPEPTVRSNAKDIITDLSSIREKQESMDNMLLKMKQENELLWRELTSMRQKHKAQEEIIQKVIQFLVSIVQRSNQNLGVKRKIARMLHDSPLNKGKATQVATRRIVMKNNSDCFITVPEDKAISPHGPVIHEVTDFEHEDSPATISSYPGSAGENTAEIECPLNSNLNSPINTSETMEPLSILEALHSSSPESSAEQCVADEHVLGIPFGQISNVISIPEDITLQNTTADVSQPSTSYVLSPTTISSALSPSFLPNEDFGLSESLLTPKVPCIEVEDSCSSFAEVIDNTGVATNHGVKDILLGDVKDSQNENNYQVAVSDSSLMKSTALTKNASPSHESHLETLFEDHLNWLQDQSLPNSWNDYASKLLGLFSSDEVANNECLSGEIAGEEDAIKMERNGIVGNELVQFTPSMLEMDPLNSPFFDYITEDTEVPMVEKSNEVTSEEKDMISLDALVNNMKTIKNECTTNDDTIVKTSVKRPTTKKAQRCKRRKTK